MIRRKRRYKKHKIRTVKGFGTLTVILAIAAILGHGKQWSSSKPKTKPERPKVTAVQKAKKPKKAKTLRIAKPTPVKKHKHIAKKHIAKKHIIKKPVVKKHKTRKAKRTLKIKHNAFSAFYTHPKVSAPHMHKARFSIKPMPYYHGRRMWKLGRLDYLGRATGSHIQIKASQARHKHGRTGWIWIRPSGWHQCVGHIHGKRVWGYNRGHLIAWAFVHRNNVKRNLITETAYLNKGSITYMNSHNPKSQLYYEMKLLKWTYRHPSCSLDYSVVPLYHNHELVPRAVRLTFMGYSRRGHHMRIKMPTRRVKYAHAVSWVILKNSSPHMHINYATGRARIY